MHQHGLAGVEAGDVHEVGPGGAHRLGEARGVDEVEAGRDREQLRRRDDDALGVPAAREQPSHALADAPAADVGADRGDGAGDLEAGPRRRAGR